MTTTVLFLCKDVFFWPVVKEAIGCHPDLHLVIIRSLEDPKCKELQAENVACCLIDLASLEASQISSTVSSLRKIVGETTRIVAFGPHVQESRLTAAQQAGCSPVLSRGQFHSQLPSLLTEWLT